MRSLYPHQEGMVRYLKENKNAALYAEMRLGKCITTIRALKDEPGRKLIICPKTVIPVWCEELLREGVINHTWLSSDWRHNLITFTQLGGQLPEWVVVNYEGVQRLGEKMMKWFNTVIIDESTAIKSPTTKITKYCLQHLAHCKRKILLSGNPAPNTPLEYFPQMQFLYGKWMNCENYWQFRHRYFASDLMGWQWWARSSSKDVIRVELQKSAYLLSRKDVGLESIKVYEKRYVEMPKALAKEYKRMEKEFVVNLPNGKQLETQYILAKLSYLQQLASGHCSKQKFSDFKIKELISLLMGELKNEAVVVWCQFRWEIDEIAKALHDRKIMALKITGDTKLEFRKEYQAKFNAGKFNVLIMQVQTGKFGINLARSSTAIYFSNSLVPENRDQSEARIDLVTKKEPLLYLDLVTKNTVDETILKNLQKKKKNSRYFMESVVQELKEKYK